MIHLFNFIIHVPEYAGDYVKPLEAFADGQPQCLGGYIALFNPNTAPKKTGFYSAYWFATNNSKTIKQAAFIKKIKN